MATTLPDGRSAAAAALNAALDRHTITRFWRHTRRDPAAEPDDACLLWTGAATKAGYGVFSMPCGTKVLAHRLAHRIAAGAIAPGDVVRHRCDTPLCVRPAHLEAGSHAQNMIDAVKRGRHGTARLNIDQVRDIRRLRAAGETMPAIAEQLDTTPVLVRAVLRGSSYAWVDADEPSTTEPPPPT